MGQVVSPEPQSVIAFSATMKLERMGKKSITIPANTQSGNGTVVLSPALPDVIGNYDVFATVNDANSVAPSWASAFLINTTTLRLTAIQPQPRVVAAASTGVTVAGNDLASVSQPASPATHGSDIIDGVLGHGHNTQSHPVTDPQHTHVLSPGASGALTVNVDWMIIHN